jgi:hypothetical protein
MSARLEWDDGQTIEVATVDELDRAVSRIHEAAADEPVVAELILDNGDSLGIGLGRLRTVMWFVAGSKEPPYLTTVGDERVDPNEVIVFTYGDEPTEYPAIAAIPIERAIEALKEFFVTEKLPTSVDWVTE